MSFNIPIIFDDSPFFDWGDTRRSQHRRNDRSSDRRQPSVFGQWADPEFFYDYPTRKQHYRPNYGERKQQYGRESPKENRFDEGAQEDIYDTQEHKRAPRSNFGYDGWDIPVEHMDRPSHKHHKHRQMPKQKTRANKVHHYASKAHHDVSNDNEEPKLPQRKLNEASKTNEITSDTSNKIEHCNEGVKVKSEKQSKVISEEENMQQQPKDDSLSQTTEGSSQTTESENSETTEIPIAYSPRKNTRRRLSKRLSQCDPPSPADIKLARIKSIVEKTEGIEEKIAEFEDPAQNKKYLYISETLMKILLDLDTVDSEGFDNVRKARKEGVKTVQALVDKLEEKLEENKRTSSQK
jgi:hypothetical protein